MKSWKIGAIAGLIAGFIGGIVAAISLITIFSFGLPFYYVPTHYPPPDVLFSNLATFEIIFSIIWGIILGIIYSEIYDLIPGKNVIKGLYYGLLLYLIIGVRFVTYYIFYGDIPKAISWISVIFVWIAYGLILGLLYDFLCNRYYPKKKELKIKTYDMQGGILPGAIAGIIDGMVAMAPNIIGPALGLFEIPESPKILTLDFLINQAGTHIFINMLWGIIFGALFARIYNLVPGRGILKGLIYGLIIYLITTFLWSTFWMGWGLESSASIALSAARWGIITGFFSTGITLGLVLGILYKPKK